MYIVESEKETHYYSNIFARYFCLFFFFLKAINLFALHSLVKSNTKTFFSVIRDYYFIKVP